MVVYETGQSFGYYQLSAHEPDGILTAIGESTEKSADPILVFSQLVESTPFIVVVIQDKTLSAETAAVEVTTDAHNALGATTGGKVGVVMISPAPINDWETVTLYDDRGKVLYREENPSIQQLRVMNSGEEDIDSLILLFPGPTADAEARRIEFGDIPVGGITDYRAVPGGMYRNAAYEYLSGSRLVEQPVVDWIGESQLLGHKFTYRIALDPGREFGDQAQLVEILVDQP